MFSPPPGHRPSAPPPAAPVQTPDDLFMLDDDEADVIPISALIAAISAESAGGPLPAAPAPALMLHSALREKLRHIEAEIRQHWMALRTLVREHELLRVGNGRPASQPVAAPAAAIVIDPPAPPPQPEAPPAVTPTSALGPALASLSRPQKSKSFLAPRYRTAAE